MEYNTFHRAMTNGTARWVVPQWACGILGEVARGRTSITAMRHPLGFICIPVERAGDHGVCVHVWSGRLSRTSPTTSAMHAHSWDLISYVLYGSLRNEL